MDYPKAQKYQDFETIYRQCSGPGGLKLAEFMADRLKLQAGMLLLDVGINRGYQTCFLAKEYQVFAVGIDPWRDREDQRLHIDHLMDNAKMWGVEKHILGVETGVPETKFATGSFDAVYTTTTMEMIRGMQGEEAYRSCLKELHRVLRPGGLLALGEPMHLDIPLPQDLVTVMPPGDLPWDVCFSTISKTAAAVQSQGFEIVEADYAPDARVWWQEFARFDPFCQAKPEEEPRFIEADQGHWLSFGYVIARKPLNQE